MGRAERRRAERAKGKQPVIIAGDGVIATELTGSRYEAKPHAELPTKVPGQHRWVATGSWVLSNEAVEKAQDADTLKFLDHENLMYIGFGCWDCEQVLGQQIQPGSVCPAPGND